MASVGWNSSQNHDHLSVVQEIANSLGTGGAGRSGAATAAPGISRSQDDANVNYIFQRQNEGELSTFKKWVGGGDDSMLSQMSRGVSELSMSNEYSKKLWGYSNDEDRGQEKGGAGNIFTSGSPWAPPSSSGWASPSESLGSGVRSRRSGAFPSLRDSLLTTHLNPLPSFGEDMVDFIIGEEGNEEPTSKPSSRLPSKFAASEGETDKNLKLKVETSSPFEADVAEAEKETSLIRNGLEEEAFRSLAGVRSSPAHEEEKVGGNGGPVVDSSVGAGVSGGSRGVSVPRGANVLVGALKQEDYLRSAASPTHQPAPSVSSGVVSNSLQIEANYDPIITFDYGGNAAGAIGPPPSLDSPRAAFNGPENYGQPPMGNFMRMGPLPQQALGPGPQQQTLGSMSQQQLMPGPQPVGPHQQQMAPTSQQQQPLGPLPQMAIMGQPLSGPQQPFSQQQQQPFSQQQQQQQSFSQQQQQQQQQASQQPIQLAQPQQSIPQQQAIGIAPTANGPTFAPTQYVINGHDPYTLGIPIAAPAVQYVTAPWGIYPANILQPTGPQQAMQQQQQQMQPQQQRPGQRPMTPSQMQQDGAMGNGGGGSATNLGPGAPVAPGNMGPANQNNQQMPPSQVDFSAAGYQIIPTAYYDQNGQLVVNGGRGMNGAQIRLVSPAPILLNPQQGFPPGASVGFNGPIQNMGQQQQLQQQPPQQQQQTQQQQQNFQQSQQQNFQQSQQLAFGNGNPVHDFPLDQRRESYDPNDKFRTPNPQPQPFTPFGMPSPAGPGPLGLVQPAQPLTPPSSLGSHNPSMGLGLGSGRPYNAAPGAENKYRNANAFMGSGNNFSGGQKNGHKGGVKDSQGRSRLLEDFRGSLLPSLQLKDLPGHVVEFSKDQHGSRFIQQKLERATSHEKALVFGEVLTSAVDLMTDVFGNYVIQKFFEFGTLEQKQALASKIRGNVLSLALQMYGCRVIQKALESIPKEMQVDIVKELDSHVLKCVKDQNGNHVVQKCIECVEPAHLQFIIDAFNSPATGCHVFTLSTHPYGCRVIQRILEHCTPAQTQSILEQLHQRVEQLVEDQYGNYVIQHVLEHGRPEDRAKIINMVKGKVLQLSQHKFASNVVEKCVAHSSRPDRILLIEEVCTGNDPQGPLYIMMKDQFANYVVQKMIDVADNMQRKVLMHKIRPHTATLRKFTYGKHILNKIDKYFTKNSGEFGGGGGSMGGGGASSMM